MFYRISRTINMVISCLFIVMAALSLAGEKTFDTAMLIITGIVFFSSIFFIAFDITCNKMYKYNTEQVATTKQLKNTGKVFFVLNLLAALAMSILVIAAFVSFVNDISEKTKEQLVIYYTILPIFTLGAVTGIINLFFFPHSLKKNKRIAIGIIDDIGKYS